MRVKRLRLVQALIAIACLVALGLLIQVGGTGVGTPQAQLSDRSPVARAESVTMISDDPDRRAVPRSSASDTVTTTAAEIVVRVFDEKGEPAALVPYQVADWEYRWAGRAVASGFTDETGEARFEWEKGGVWVTAVGDGNGEPRPRLPVTVIELHARCSAWHGVVRVLDPDGKPVAGATVAVSTYAADMVPSTVLGLTGASGELEVEGGSARASYLCAASHPDHASSVVEVLGEKRDVVLQLRRGGRSIDGVVLDPRGKAVEGAWVVVGQRGVHGPRFSRSAWVRSGISDEFGRFHVDGVGSIERVLWCWKEGFGLAETELGSSGYHEVVLVRGVTVRARGGRSHYSIRRLGMHRPPDLMAYPCQESVERWDVAWANVGPGRWSVSTWHDGGERESREVAVDEKDEGRTIDVEFPLDVDQCDLTGTIADAPGHWRLMAILERGNRRLAEAEIEDGRFAIKASAGHGECSVQLIGNAWSMTLVSADVMLPDAAQLSLSVGETRTGSLETTGLAEGSWEIWRFGRAVGRGLVQPGVNWLGVPVGEYELVPVPPVGERVAVLRSVRQQ